MDLKLFLALVEQTMAECDRLDSAPFPLSHDEAKIYLEAKRNTLQWVLEMLA